MKSDFELFQPVQYLSDICGPQYTICFGLSLLPFFWFLSHLIKGLTMWLKAHLAGFKVLGAPLEETQLEIELKHSELYLVQVQMLTHFHAVFGFSDP